MLGYSGEIETLRPLIANLTNKTTFLCKNLSIKVSALPRQQKKINRRIFAIIFATIVFVEVRRHFVKRVTVLC